MPFENPIVAGEELIRPGIRSQNYVQGVSGWRIGRDNSAEFDSVVVRGTMGVERVEARELTIEGVSVYDQIINLARGSVARYANPSAVWDNVTAGGAEIGLIEMTVYLEAGRMLLLLPSACVSYDDSRCEARLFVRSTFDAGGNPPPVTISSDQIYGRQFSDNSPVGYGKVIESQGWWIPAATGTYRLLMSVFAAGIGSFDVVTNGNTLPPPNFLLTDIGNEALSANTYGQVNRGTGTVALPRTRYDNTWWWTGIQSYQENGSPSSASNANSWARQGDGAAVGTPGGNHIGFFFFDSADIRANLAGATILESYIYLDNVHCYLNSGLSTIIGIHNNDPIPGASINYAQGLWNYHVNKGGDLWTPNLGNGLGDNFRDGHYRGITVGRGPDNDVNYYGYFNRCAVRFVYEK